VRLKYFFRLFSIPLGMALLSAAPFFNAGAAVSSPAQLQQATPTPDRLAQPTLPSSPSQADLGSQVYWLSCLPCHGDRGQGLTDEFRQAYPKEDQNCWDSGCHGERPYDHGFTLPKQIPALVGPQALQKFPDAAALHAYIAAAMPFWKPGSLGEQDYWSVTAFLLRQNGLWDASSELGPSGAAQVPVGPAATPAASPIASSPSGSAQPLLMIAIGLVVLILLAFLFWRRIPR
jgi:mono/diheme cytochrome c family protein